MSVSLVCMPWHMLGSPSIQLGTLQGVLDRAGVPCRSHSFHLEFESYVDAHAPPDRGGFSIDDYGEVCSRWENVGAGDWAFAVPPLSRSTRADEDRYAAFLRAQGMPRKLLRGLTRLRKLVPAFLQRCADEILAAQPAVVGFTNVYSQTWPSAALAHVLKARDPSLRIVFGGSGCEGSMGAALLLQFPQIDVVVRGEAEGVLVELMQSLMGGAPVAHLPGICAREDGRVVEGPAADPPRAAMDDVPVPVYDEYFERLSESSLASVILPQIPFESARGCWWGMKAHCTFCGLNGMDMQFRSKSSDRVLEEVTHLARKHGVLDFTAVDNILDMRYFTTLLPRLSERELDLSFFYEIKANLTEAHVRALRDAGVRTIQPGIESLSTPVLELMKKGVTAFQNIRLLKWCAQYDIRVIWNLLYGFPRESPEEYARMADVVPSLVHLEPPTLSELAVYRFSPYHDRPAEHGLTLRGPLPFYGMLYDLEGESLADLAQAFAYEHADARDPKCYVAPVRSRVERWNRERERNRGALTYRRGPGFLVITDTRTTTTAGPARYTLGEAEAAAYLACASGAKRDAIAADLASRPGRRLTDSELTGLLHDFVAARLVYEEGGKYLSLALPNPG